MKSLLRIFRSKAVDIIRQDKKSENSKWLIEKNEPIMRN
ncbi:hypothetical protein LEP1GSC059_0797 [Leptospira noguchii serovar Panama str. CZ214]|uniref:Uncharacterized protein n=1 Tax=Leptospira noguchii serovar Panama str. CZ214 TaxID=1001595 RepID=T0FSD6_9LEPT|nr:hypothetical protein LEP1GSC059_0797 [Leptospira noguchii serovar Panama str. CZ214]